MHTGETAIDTDGPVFIWAPLIQLGTPAATYLQHVQLTNKYIFRPDQADGFVEFFGNNPATGNTTVFTAWGYRWDNEAWKLTGGPVRPGEIPQFGFQSPQERAGDRPVSPGRVAMPTGLLPPFGEELRQK